MMCVDAQGLHYRELNRLVREAVAGGERRVRLDNVLGQRYIADGITEPAIIEVHGTPGADLGAFMSGPTVVVRGNCQDGPGNTMDDGRIVVHGSAGDVVGYAMRGGTVIVRDNVGYRVGIHMKGVDGKQPAIVVGGCAMGFFAEYMAGGTAVVLGLTAGPKRTQVGQFCATGMHGGEVFIRGEVDDWLYDPRSVRAKHADDDDRERIRGFVLEYCTEFGADPAPILDAPFTVLRPASHRPYGSSYAH